MKSTQQFAAWRFTHPDLEAQLTSGLHTTHQGGIAMTNGGASVRQSVLLLLTTRPGERVMRPDYGCELHKLVFAPNDATTAGLAIHYVRRALRRWEPRVSIVMLDARRSAAEPSLLEIELRYRVQSTLEEAELFLQLDLITSDSR